MLQPWNRTVEGLSSDVHECFLALWENAVLRGDVRSTGLQSCVSGVIFLR